MKTIYQLVVVVSVSLILYGNTTNAEASLYYIDALSQVDEEREALDLIIRQMNEAGSYRTILSTQRKRKGRDIIQLATKYPGRIYQCNRRGRNGYR